jgi:hypothetical protein
MAGRFAGTHMSKNQDKTSFFSKKNQYSSPRKQNAMTQLKEQ